MNCRCIGGWQVFLCLWTGAWLLLGLALSGCERQPGPAADRIPPNPNAPALYGPPTGAITAATARLRDPVSADTNWSSAPFYVLQTELSPATLVHSSSKYLGLFTGLTNYGLSAPSHLAWPTMNGPRTFQRGESLNLTNMAQNWVLVWWAGADGWTNWDSPWVIFLQHHPLAMSLDEAGLHLEFPRGAGDVVLMPLYGYEKAPQQGNDFRAKHRLAEPKVPLKTWEWPKVVTRDPLTRIRYWSSVLREFPVHCEDTFSVDRAKDAVTIRSRFHWRSIDDDWHTPHLKLAPLSPPLAHAAKESGFPVEFSKPWFDLDMPTTFGPYLATEAVDEFEATFSVLQYVNETETVDVPADNSHPGVQAALEKVHQLATQRFSNASKAGDGGKADDARAMLEAAWMARALPHLDAATRSNAVRQLGDVLRADLRLADRSTGASVDAAPLVDSLFTALWALSHFSGDWTLAKEQWPIVRKLFTAPKLSRWAGFGSDGAVAADARASGAIAFARLAYRVGDMDAYQYACGIVARELTLAFVKQRGAEYFRKHQPWHSLELMDEEVFLTHLRNDGGGWHLDGPKFPSDAPVRQFTRRWQRFHDPDVARFFRDYFRDDVHQELNWLQRWSQQNSNWWGAGGGPPSFVPLRSLLHNASPAELASVAGVPDPSKDSPFSEMANCLSILRSSRPTRFERLIPPGSPSPFAVGIERDVAGPNVRLLTFIGVEKAGPNAYSSVSVPDWPQLRWLEWRTPTGAAWTFGHIRPVRQGAPTRVESVPLNWNTRVLRFELP